MKSCINCGHHVPDEVHFCGNCGANCQDDLYTSQNALSQDQYVTSEKDIHENHPLKKGQSAKKLKVILPISIIVVAIITCGILFLRWYLSADQRALRFLRDGKYEEALEIVEDEDLDYSDEYEKVLINRLNELKGQYSSGTIEYAAINDEIDAIEKMEVKGVADKITEVRTFAEELNESRTSFAAAERLFASGEYVSALDMYKKVIKTDSNYEAAKTGITNCISNYRQNALAEAAKYAENGNYTNAITVLNSALEVLPGDSELTSQKLLYEKDDMDRIKTEALNEAASFASGQDYKNAIAVLDQYSVDYGDDSDVSIKRNEYKEAYIAEVLENVDHTDDYSEKIKLLQDGLDVFYDDTRLNNRLTAVIEEYAEMICGKAEALVEDKKYEDAVDLIDEALKVVPANATLLSKKEEIENKIPKKFLNECKPYESSYYEEYINGRTFTMAAEYYTDGLILNNQHGYGLWNLNARYTQLEFDVGHIDGSYMQNATVEIYLDGVLYKSLEIKADGLPEHISIDLKGVKQLKIKLAGTGWNGAKVGIGNMIVKKA